MPRPDTIPSPLNARLSRGSAPRSHLVGGTFARGEAAAPCLSPFGAALALAMASVLCWPMLLTTAPLVYFDTVSYFTNGEKLWWGALGALGGLLGLAGSAALDTAQAGAIEGGAGAAGVTFRSLTYAAFFYPAALTPLGLVLVCILQTAMTLFVFLALVPPLTARGVKAAAAGFGAVAVLSSLPWFASYAMPDLLGAVLPAYFALALGRADGFGTIGRAVLMVIAIFAMLAHYGHLPVALILAVAVVAWRALRRSLSWSALVFCLLPVVAAFGFNLAVSIAVNMASGPALASAAETEVHPRLAMALVETEGSVAARAAEPAVREREETLNDNDALDGASFAPNRVPVLLARSIEDGPARWYLQRECDEHGRYAICELFDEIPGNVWAILWAADGLRTATPEQMARIRNEETAIVFAAARRYPIEQGAALARNTLLQMMKIGTGELLPVPRMPAGAHFTQMAPSEEEAGAHPVLALFDWVTPMFTALAFIALAWRVASGRTQHFLAEAAVLVLFALLVNAAVYGGLSAPVDRYQSRLAWLIPALLALDLAVSSRFSRIRVAAPRLG